MLLIFFLFKLLFFFWVSDKSVLGNMVLFLFIIVFIFILYEELLLVLFEEFLLFLVDFGELKVLVINDFLALIEELL